MANFALREHKWIDGSMSLFRDWDYGQPDFARLEACVAASNRNGKWVDDYCSARYRFLCMPEMTPSPTSPPVVGGGCPEGMAEFGKVSVCLDGF